MSIQDNLNSLGTFCVQNINVNSQEIGLGNQSLALGGGAVAIGYQALASATDSISLGTSTASGISSVAVAFNAQSTGLDSVAIGKNSIASGGASVALGRDTNAANNNAICIGNLATTNNQPNTLVINATGVALTAPAKGNSTYIAPIAVNEPTYVVGGAPANRTSVAQNTYLVGYNTATNELFYFSGGA